MPPAEPQRGTPVTLEEMTRRRDGWRARWDKTDRELQAARAHVRQLGKQLLAAELAVRNHATIVSRLTQRAQAAEAEARRFAQECGALRDQAQQLQAELDKHRHEAHWWRRRAPTRRAGE